MSARLNAVGLPESQLLTGQVAPVSVPIVRAYVVSGSSFEDDVDELGGQTTGSDGFV